MRTRARKMIVWAPLALVGFAAFVALGGVIVRWLWNWLLPPLFGWPTLTFWQALALLALCRILFGSFGGGGGAHRRRIHQRLEERWQDMTPEERDRFRHGAFGHGGSEAGAGEGTRQ